ncbi:MAG: Rrf2 family transcriptional regulator [Candidatus Omnitrophica bacterium]|nr:Rrf2 family transcriptional regulator [Candidatus Omnitrophota bacterium]
MKLTTKSEYTLLALLFMARRKEDEYIKVDDICKKYEISKKYLEYLFTILRQNGYIKTRRGAGGGYRLARAAGKISLAQIIRLMDGALAPTESVSKYFYSETPLKKEKKVLTVFQDIRDYIAHKLEKLTLADLI